VIFSQSSDLTNFVVTCQEAFVNAYKKELRMRHGRLSSVAQESISTLPEALYGLCHAERWHAHLADSSVVSTKQTRFDNDVR
jgi:hypothetical protein